MRTLKNKETAKGTLESSWSNPSNSHLSPPIKKEDVTKRLKCQKAFQLNAYPKKRFVGLGDKIFIEKEVKWTQWLIGQTYQKILLMKNCGLRDATITFIPPPSAVFILPHPRPITLCPGISFQLPVTFCPKTYDNLHDSNIVVTTAEHDVAKVQLIAQLRPLKVALPKELVFEQTAVFQTLLKTFAVKNTSAFMLRFCWHTLPPFSISPSQGLMLTEQIEQFRVEFKPLVPKNYDVEAVLEYGTDESSGDGGSSKKCFKSFSRLRLRGHGRTTGCLVFADILKSAGSSKIVPVNVGTVPVGHAHHASVKVFNQLRQSVPYVLMRESNNSKQTSPLRAGQDSGRIVCIPPPSSGAKQKLLADGKQPTFHPDNKLGHGILKGRAWNNIPIKFRPNTPGRQCVSYMELRTAFDGNHKPKVLMMKGVGTGPRVNFSEMFVNMGTVRVKSNVTKIVRLQNNTTSDGGSHAALFQFFHDSNSSPFHVEPLQGHIAAGGSVKITLTFRPEFSMVHFKHLICLVKDQGPLQLDVFGVSFCDEDQHALVFCDEIQKRYENFGRRMTAQFQRDSLCGAEETNKTAETDGGVSKDLPTVFGPKTVETALSCAVDNAWRSLFSSPDGTGSAAPVQACGTSCLYTDHGSGKRALPTDENDSASRRTTANSASPASHVTGPNKLIRSSSPDATLVHAVTGQTAAVQTPAAATIKPSSTNVANSSQNETAPRPVSTPVTKPSAVRTINSTFNRDIIVFNDDELYFGWVRPNFTALKQLTVRNLHNTRVDVCWSSDHSGVFNAEPRQQTIAALSSATFQVSFQPAVDGRHYQRHLECYVDFTYRDAGVDNSNSLDDSLSDQRFVSNWCYMLNVVGHSIEPDCCLALVPQVHLDRPTIEFEPPSSIPTNMTKPALSYQTCYFHNKSGDDTVIFRCDKVAMLNDAAADAKAAVFDIRPRVGVIAPKQYQIFAFSSHADRQAQRTTAPNINDYISGEVIFQLNDCKLYEQRVKLLMATETTAMNVTLEPQEVVFAPTAIGYYGKRDLQMRNLSLSPVDFKWSIRQQTFRNDSGANDMVLNICPLKGRITPNETISFEVTFQPFAEESYEMAPLLLLSHNQSQQTCKKTVAAQRRSVRLFVSGRGVHGVLEAEQQRYEFLDLTCSMAAERFIRLRNNSPFSMQAALEVIANPSNPKNTSSSAGDEQQQSEKRKEVELDGDVFHVAGHSVHSVRLTLRPNWTGTHQYAIYCRLPGPRIVSDCRVLLCEFVVVVTQPSLMVVDIACDEQLQQAQELGRNRCWNMLQIPLMNKKLAAPLNRRPPSPPIYHQSMLTYRHNLYPRVRRNAPIVNMDLGGRAPLGRNFTVQLMLYNPQPVPCRWRLQYLNELKLHVESWGHSRELASQHESSTASDDSRSILSVRPRHGYILPRASQTMTICYRRREQGEHKLLALLTIANGAEIWLALKAQTASVDERILVVLRDSCALQPCVVSRQLGCVQDMDVYNPTRFAIQYHVDQSVIDEQVRAVSNTSRLECLDCDGQVMPRSYHTIRWRFSPREPFVFNVKVTLHYVEGEDKGGAGDSINSAVENSADNDRCVFTLVASGVLTRDNVATLAATLPSVSDIRPIMPADDIVTDTTSPRKKDGFANQVPQFDEALYIRLGVSLINFGVVPKFFKARRLVLVRNTSPYRLAFAFIPDRYHASLDDIKIKPCHHGTIEPLGLAGVVFEYRPTVADVSFSMMTFNLLAAKEDEMQAYCAARHQRLRNNVSDPVSQSSTADKYLHQLVGATQNSNTSQSTKLPATARAALPNISKLRLTLIGECCSVALPNCLMHVDCNPYVLPLASSFFTQNQPFSNTMEEKASLCNPREVVDQVVKHFTDSRLRSASRNKSKSKSRSRSTNRSAGSSQHRSRSKQKRSHSQLRSDNLTTDTGHSSATSRCSTSRSARSGSRRKQKHLGVGKKRRDKTSKKAISVRNVNYQRMFSLIGNLLQAALYELIVEGDNNFIHYAAREKLQSPPYFGQLTARQHLLRNNGGEESEKPHSSDFGRATGNVSHQRGRNDRLRTEFPPYWIRKLNNLKAMLYHGSNNCLRSWLNDEATAFTARVRTRNIDRCNDTQAQILAKSHRLRTSLVNVTPVRSVFDDIIADAIRSVVCDLASAGAEDAAPQSSVSKASSQNDDKLNIIKQELARQRNTDVTAETLVLLPDIARAQRTFEAPLERL